MAGCALSYGVARDYPYRFFTPLVIVGGLAFLALFSFINLASSGFTLIVEYSSDPNATVAQSWSHGMPKLFASKLQPFCQPSSINSETKIKTSNNALLYTIASVRAYDNDTVLPSLVYLNNPLESCNVSQVTIYLERAGGRTAGEIAAAAWGVTVHGSSTCRVELDAGPVEVNLTAGWVPFPATITTFDGANSSSGRSDFSSPNAYWGQSLLANHRVSLGNSLEALVGNATKREIRLVVRDSGEIITELLFFRISTRSVVLKIQEDGSIDRLIHYDDNGNSIPWQIGIGSSYWLSIDNLAKSFYSVILTDLGQKAAVDNILGDTLLLQHFTANFSDILKGKDITGSGPASQDYDTLKDGTGPPKVTAATLAVNYLCNVPQRKSWSELVVSILVADLVFMRALWSIFTLIMSGWVKSKEKTGNWCEGCLSLASLPDEDKRAEDQARDFQDDGDRSPGIPLLRLGSRASFQERSGQGR